MKRVYILKADADNIILRINACLDEVGTLLRSFAEGKRLLKEGKTRSFSEFAHYVERKKTDTDGPHRIYRELERLF